MYSEHLYLQGPETHLQPLACPEVTFLISLESPQVTQDPTYLKLLSAKAVLKWPLLSLDQHFCIKFKAGC